MPTRSVLMSGIVRLIGYLRLADSTYLRVAVQHRPFDTSTEAGERRASIRALLPFPEKVRVSLARNHNGRQRVSGTAQRVAALGRTWLAEPSVRRLLRRPRVSLQEFALQAAWKITEVCDRF